MAIRHGDYKLVRYDTNADTLTGAGGQPVSSAQLYNLADRHRRIQRPRRHHARQGQRAPIQMGRLEQRQRPTPLGRRWRRQRKESQKG